MASVARTQTRRYYRGNNATSTSWSHKVLPGGNRMLRVQVWARNNGTVSAPTYGGTALTLVPGSEIAAGTGTSRRYVSWWYMLAPPVGTATLSLTVAAADSGNYGVLVYNDIDVDQTTPFRDQGGGNYALTDSGTAVTSSTLTPASAVGDLVVSALYSQNAPTYGAGQYREANGGISGRCWTMSKEAESGTTSIGATMASGTVVHSAIAIIGAATTQPDPADYTGSRGKKSWIAAYLYAGEPMSAGATLNFGITPSPESGVGAEISIVGSACEFSAPVVTVSSNATTAASTLSLLINGAASGVTVTIPAGTTGRITGSGTASATVGDTVDWQMVVGAGGSLTIQSAELVCEASGSETISYIAAHTSGAALLLPGQTWFNNIHGQRSSGMNARGERSATFPVMFDAAWSGLRLNTASQTLDGTVEVVSRINGADGTQRLDWAANEAGNKYDSTHTDTVSDGDLLAWRMTAAGSTGDFNHERFSSRLRTTNGEFAVMSGSASNTNGINVGAAGTVYLSLLGELGGGQGYTTESAMQFAAPYDMALKRFWIKTGENTSVASGANTATLRVNGADTALSVDVAPGAEFCVFEDTEHVVNINAGDLISVSFTYGTGGANNTMRIRAVGFVAVERVGGTAPTLVIADAAHAHTADNLTLSAATALVVADAAHAHTADNLALTADSLLAIADAAHAHTADNLALSTSSLLTVADAAHAHTADNLALTADSLLAIADALHAHATDNLTLSIAGSTSLVVADATHAQLADSLDLTSAHALSVADALHGHTADNVDFSGTTALTIADALHAHAADSLTLSTAIQLFIADALHAHNTDNLELSSAPYLDVQDALHGHAAENLAFSLQSWLVVADALHTHTADNLTLIILGEVVIDDITAVELSMTSVVARLSGSTFSVQLMGSHLQ